MMQYVQVAWKKKKIPALQRMMNGSELCDVGDTQQWMAWSWFSGCFVARFVGLSFCICHTTCAGQFVSLTVAVRCDISFWLYWHLKHMGCAFVLLNTPMCDRRYLDFYGLSGKYRTNHLWNLANPCLCIISCLLHICPSCRFIELTFFFSLF